MRKIYLFLILQYSISFYGNDTITAVSIKNINLRENATTDSKVITEIKPEDTLIITETENGWSKAIYKNSLNGYVKSEFTKEINAEKKNEKQINWKIKVLFFCLKIILAFIFINLSLKYLIYLEKKLDYYNIKFKLINYIVLPSLIFLSVYLSKSWVFLFSCLVIIFFKGGTSLGESNIKYKTKSGRADKRYTKNQEITYSSDDKIEEKIADNVFIIVLYIVIPTLIIINIKNLFF